VRRQFLAKKQKLVKTRRSSGFRNLLWKCNINEIEELNSQIQQNNDIHHLHKEVLIIFLQDLMNLLQKTIQLMMMNLDILKYIQVWLLDQPILFEQQEISMEMNGLVM